MSLCFYKNALVDISEAIIDPRDSGFSRGLCVNEFVPIFSGTPFYLEAHLERLKQSATLLNFEIDLQELENICHKLIASNTVSEGYLKIFIVGGRSDDLCPKEEPYLLVLTGQPRPCFPTFSRLKLVEAKRTFPLCKSNNYLEGYLAQMEAEKLGFSDALLFDDGQVRETATANFFAVVNDRVITPKSDVLNGITRDIVLELSNGAQRDISVDEVGAIDEAFLTSSSRMITPVLQIDGSHLSDVPGPVTRDLITRLEDVVENVVKKPPIPCV